MMQAAKLRSVLWEQGHITFMLDVRLARELDSDVCLEWWHIGSC